MPKESSGPMYENLTLLSSSGTVTSSPSSIPITTSVDVLVNELSELEESELSVDSVVDDSLLVVISTVDKLLSETVWLDDAELGLEDEDELTLDALDSELELMLDMDEVLIV